MFEANTVFLLRLVHVVLDPELWELWKRDGQGGAPAVCARQQSDGKGSEAIPWQADGIGCS
jgi:hypothetical protein